jgi:hypothetical protein
MNRDEWLAVLSVALIVLAAPATVVLGATLSHEATSGTTYQTNSGLTVTLTDDRTVEAAPFDGDRTFENGSVRLTSDGGEIGIGDGTYNGEEVTVSDVQATNPITVERTDLGKEFTIESGDASTLQVRNVTLDNGTADVAYASNNGVTLTLNDLPNVGVAAVDTGTGDIVDDTVVGTDGTATFDLPAGTRQIELQTVPSELQVRNEVQPDQLVDGDNVTLRARFFGSDGETVVERNVTDGTVSLDGLPADQELVVTVKEANADFVYRRILIENIVETQEIYILPTDEPSAEIRFELNDQTDRFGDDTKLFVEKAITRNNQTEYRVISGDTVGADGRFPTILVDSERYRIRVENADGEQRVLGSYVVQGADRARLTIGDVQFSADVSEGAAMQASLRAAPDGASHDDEIRLVYLDPEGETDSITISVEDQNGNQIRPETTETLDGSTDRYVETYPLKTSFNPDEDTATVTVDAQRGLETETFTEQLGDVPEVFENAPIPMQVLELMGFVSIVALIGLLVIVKPSMAALVGSGWAGLLTLVGIVPIPMPAVVLAGVVSVLVTVGTSGRLR